MEVFGPNDLPVAFEVSPTPESRELSAYLKKPPASMREAVQRGRD